MRVCGLARRTKICHTGSRGPCDVTPRTRARAINTGQRPIKRAAQWHRARNGRKKKGELKREADKCYIKRNLKSAVYVYTAHYTSEQSPREISEQRTAGLTRFPAAAVAGRPSRKAKIRAYLYGISMHNSSAALKDAQFKAKEITQCSGSRVSTR